MGEDRTESLTSALTDEFTHFGEGAIIAAMGFVDDALTAIDRRDHAHLGRFDPHHFVANSTNCLLGLQFYQIVSLDLALQSFDQKVCIIRVNA